MHEFIAEHYPSILILLVLAALFCFLAIFAKIDSVKSEILRRVTATLGHKAWEDDGDLPTVPRARSRPQPRRPRPDSQAASPSSRPAARD